MYDHIVIGAGLVGLSTAYHILKKFPGRRVLVLEKENAVAVHQSGHNSGVIHSGIYYKPGSLKAKNCLEGYDSLISFAEEHNIRYEICGKIIVATSREEVPLLDEIYKRGTQNGLENLQYLSREEFKEIEPFCEGVKAVKVPQTGIIDFPSVAKTLKILIENLGGEVKFREEVISISRKSEIVVTTKSSEFETKNLVSCAGLFSDRVANMTQQSKDFIIVPFRGEYYKLKDEKKHMVKHLIYPVPDPNFPFLGVHFTRMIDGNVEAGPNAVLAFKREGYKFSDANFSDIATIVNFPGFWKIAQRYGRTGLGEIYRSLSKPAFTRALQKLMPAIREEDLIPGGAGVRAQALRRDGSLIDDFDILKNGNIIHVRNAPSPAATANLSIGKHIASLLN